MNSIKPDSIQSHLSVPAETTDSIRHRAVRLDVQYPVDNRYVKIPRTINPLLEITPEMNSWLKSFGHQLRLSCIPLNFEKQVAHANVDRLKADKAFLKSELAFALSSTSRTVINNALRVCNKDLEAAQKHLEMITAKAAQTIQHIEALEKYLKDSGQPLPDFVRILVEQNVP